MSIRNYNFVFQNVHPHGELAVSPIETNASEQPSVFSLLAQDPPLASRDELIFLLHIAAEVEHALLVEYLYAAYSLTDASQHRPVLVKIAKEEMAHLIAVQNVLLCLGAPLNFDREPEAYNTFYPFPFKLQPLSLRSVAQYVLAEMPMEVPAGFGFDLPTVKLDAGIQAGDAGINRVGALFERILDLIRTLPETEFSNASLPYQGDDWVHGGDMIIEDVATRQNAVDLLKAVAAQGEGPELGVDSHFERFFNIYQDIKSGGLTDSLGVGADPNVHNSAAPGYIESPLARAWAAFANTRYRLLMTDMVHSFLYKKSAPGNPEHDRRKALTTHAITEMGRLRTINAKLIALPRHTVPQSPGGVLQVASLPFELPYSLNLPAQERDRWRTHLDILQEAAIRAQAITALLGQADPALTNILNADSQSKTLFESFM